MGNEDSPDSGERPYLQGLVGSLSGRRLVLDGRQVLGRDATQCQFVLEQAVVSRRHAEISVDGLGRVTITDLGSRQGTFVNGNQVERHELRDGDRVGFGPGGIVAFTFHGARNGDAASPPKNEPASRAEVLMAQFIAAAQLAGGAKDADVHSAKAARAVNAAPSLPRAAEKDVLQIGRAPDNDIVLEASGVSRRHASLSYEGGAQHPVLTDLGSTNGTFVNGQPLTERRPLKPHDLVFLGGFLLRVNGRDIKRHDLSASRITARDITKELGGREILRGVSLALYPREFVGLMGPSGCGKSTLMDALNGLRPATSGTVHVNDLDLYQDFDALRRSIGYVPQHDVLHDVLTVERTLYYAAELRLPDGTPPGELRRIVEEVIATVGLTEQRDTQFRQLSGGQQKRLSLAVELITKPSFIFLDEPTSPLDPETTENMMMLFRRLADEGRIVVMVTHKFEKFEEMHQVAILTKGGRLAYFGPPREALSYFGCREPGEIYRRIGGRDPEELARSYSASPLHRRYVAGRIAETDELTRTSGQTPVMTGAGVPEAQGGAGRGFGVRQWLTLTRRYLEIKLKDRRNTALLLLQAPFIAAVLAVIIGDVLNDAKAIFISAIIAIWFGANNAVREIVSESNIYTRERLVNLKIPSYVFSKFAVLSGIGLVQVLLFVGILVGAGRLGGGDFFRLTAILYLTLLGGVSMGLFFSALVNSTEKAMSILPLVLIPQLLLGGFLKPVDDFYVNMATGKPATVEEFERAERAKDEKATQPRVPPEPVKKWDGLGSARIGGDLMIARWSIEALSHAVSVRDEKAREKLPTQMSVVEYRHVFDGEGENEVADAYRRRVRIDALVLAAFSGVFLLLTMWALKRKDVL